MLFGNLHSCIVILSAAWDLCGHRRIVFVEIILRQGTIVSGRTLEKFGNFSKVCRFDGYLVGEVF